MRLDQYLVAHGHFETRTRAQEAIKSGRVHVAGQRVIKPGFRISGDAEVTAKAAHPYVSRGGLKLAHALKIFGAEPRGKICLDIGASTGGFTDVLLRGGARHVYAVDVGQGQLHKSLRGRTDVSMMEQTDARDLTADMLCPLPEMIVCDASFISLSKLLGAALTIPAAGAELITLIKPQFEVGKAGVGKGGIVTSELSGLQAVSDVSAWVSAQGWHVEATGKSPVKGGSRGGRGNQEFLLYAVKQ
jgi:23S rRNA (cytidine1920-2'-O)/16S rRNA (cytidine1409-2'-O)-methyltransferase